MTQDYGNFVCALMFYADGRRCATESENESESLRVVERPLRLYRRLTRGRGEQARPRQPASRRHGYRQQRGAADSGRLPQPGDEPITDEHQQEVAAGNHEGTAAAICSERQFYVATANVARKHHIGYVLFSRVAVSPVSVYVFHRT